MDSVTCIGFDQAMLERQEDAARQILSTSACPKHNDMNNARAIEDIERMQEERTKRQKMKGRTRCDGPHS
jgi:hypothetical protein